MPVLQPWRDRDEATLSRAVLGAALQRFTRFGRKLDLSAVVLQPRPGDEGPHWPASLGRAVLHDPDVILFDEPYTGLDQDASSMLDGVLKTVAAQGRTVVMTSHDLARAEELATRFDVLSHGVIAASATRKQLKKSNLLAFYKQALAS